MTKNNYPEGLDELVERLSLKYAAANGFARALLDALAERGYVMVDAKKHEPVAYLHYAKKRPDLKEVNFYSSPSNIQKNNGWVSAPLYTHPAIPGRVALPDGWKVIGEVIGCFDAAFAEGIQEALAETQD